MFPSSFHGRRSIKPPILHSVLYVSKRLFTCSLYFFIAVILFLTNALTQNDIYSSFIFMYTIYKSRKPNSIANGSHFVILRARLNIFRGSPSNID